MSGASLGATILIINFLIGGLWGITLFMSYQDETEFTTYNYSYNLSDEERETLKEKAYQSSKNDYNIPPILN